VISDLHIALPETIWDLPGRFHLVEVSIPALEIALSHLESLNLDFLLLPGDLTQNGEPKNHSWLQQRLASLPFPVYVIPGNHDVPFLSATENAIGFADFPSYYSQFGYENCDSLYYTREILPGLQLIALSSNQFDEEGKQQGYLDETQLAWLEGVLSQTQEQFVMVMIHHNVVEHLPGQSKHSLGQRYMLDNATLLRQMLRDAGVSLLFTGHLHVQDLAEEDGLYEITTGSLVSYPHPYRVLELRTTSEGKQELDIQSHRIETVPGWENLQQLSREWIGDRSLPFMMKLLNDLNIPQPIAESLAGQLRYFWADVAAGDTIFSFPNFPTTARHFFEQFGAIHSNGTPNPIDNNATLILS